MPDLVDPKVEPIEDKDMDLWSCSKCQSVFHFAITNCPVCFLLIIAETKEESEERKAFAEKYQDLPDNISNSVKDLNQLISFECFNCGRPFHLSRTLDFRDSFIISCPLCRTRQPNSVRMPEPEQPEKTRDTETGPVRSLDQLWSCCQCHTVFDRYQMCPICHPNGSAIFQSGENR